MQFELPIHKAGYTGCLAILSLTLYVKLTLIAYNHITALSETILNIFEELA